MMASVEEVHVKLRYPIEILQNTLKCVICLEDYTDAVLTRCEHLFCWECISRILKDRRNTYCPLCKEPVSRRSVTRVEYISQMIAMFIDLRDSIPKDTGFEIESFLGAPTGAREAPTNSPLTKKIRNKNSSKTEITPQACRLSPARSEVPIDSVVNVEDIVSVPEEVLTSDTACEKNINSPTKGKKFGRCYRRKSSEQSRSAHVRDGFRGDKDSVHCDSKDNDRINVLKETDLNILGSDTAAVNSIADCGNSVQACVTRDQISAKSDIQFPFSNPTQNIGEKVTAFENLLESTTESNRVLSEGRKDSQGKKIITCNTRSEKQVDTGKCEEESWDDPYVFVSSQRTPHRVKYRKDGVKDLGKVGQSHTRKNTLKKKRGIEKRKQDLCVEIGGVSLLEMGSQNFIESCPVEVNDEFDKLVIESHKSLLQSQTSSISFHDASDNINDSEDVNLAVLFRTPNNEGLVSELPGENQESIVACENHKKGRGRGIGYKKSLNISTMCLADVKSSSHRPKLLQSNDSLGKDEKSSLSQQLRQIQQQFNDVSNHALSVEQKETTVKKDTNKNIFFDVTEISPKHISRRPLQKSSKDSKRVSFADFDNKELAPADQDSNSKLLAEIHSVVSSEQCDDAGANNNNPKPSPAEASCGNSSSEITFEMPATTNNRKISYPNKHVVDVVSCETPCLKPALTFDLVSEATSFVSSPGGSVLGFVMSSASEQTQTRWKVCTASNQAILEASPGLKRKRGDADEIDDTMVTEVREGASYTKIVSDDFGVKLLVDSMSRDNEETFAQTHNKDSTSPVHDSHGSFAAGGSSSTVTELPLQHTAKKMRHCKLYKSLDGKPQGSRIDSSTSSIQRGNCDQGTQTAVKSVNVGTEVDLHLTSKPRIKTRTYVEASIQTDAVENMVEKCPVLKVDAQTSPIRINVRSTEVFTSSEQHVCGESQNTECVPGTFEETVEDAAYLAQNLKVLGTDLCSKSNSMTEESEELDFSVLEVLEKADDGNDNVILGSKLANKLPLTSNATPETKLTPSKSRTVLSFGEKDFQYNNGKQILTSTSVKAPGQSPQASGIFNSKTKGKSLLSLSSNKTSRKLSFSPNYVPTLSKGAFPMVIESASSGSDEECRPARGFKSKKRSRRLSMSSESDTEQQGRSCVDNSNGGVLNSVQVEVVSEVMAMETSQKTASNTLQSTKEQCSQSSVPASVLDVRPGPDAACEPGNPSALITPSLQALLQTAVSQESTMEFLEGGGISEPATQHSAVSTESMDMQQLQKIDLAIITSNTELVSPGNSQQREKAGQATKNDSSSVADDHEMMYDDIIQPTPQKERTFVTHRVSKTKADTSATSKILHLANVSQSQVGRPVSEVEDKSAGCGTDMHVETLQKVALGGKKQQQQQVGGQRAPLQVVTNAPPTVPRVANESLWAQKPVCIACSMLSAQSKFLVQKFVEFFNLSYSLTYHSGVTHLLVPRTDESIQSVKYVFAVAEKKWVLYEDWVRDCLRAHVLLPEEQYEVSEPVSGGPGRSRLSKDPLFKNYVMCFIPPLEAITKEQIEEVSVLCGAEVVAEPALLSCHPGRKILLVTNEKHEEMALELFKKYKIPPVSYYYVIDCISAFKLFDPYTYLIIKTDEPVFRQCGYN